jgi:EmrB/QacA subfamily drug resistance transporter
MDAPHTRKNLILVLMCLAQFMVVLDVAIVNVALPSIQEELGLRQSTLQWIVIAYTLLLGGFLLLGGRLGDLLGRRRVLLTGMSLFTAASLVAGFAQTTELLIASRAIQGFGAALILPSTLSILAMTFAEGHERNRALGIFGAVGGSSASVGVIASGLLTDGPGWRWIFFINIPVGIVLIFLSARLLAVDRPDVAVRQYDAAGASTVTGGLLLFIYGLNRGVDHGWTSASTIALFALSAILLAAFVYIESRSPAPLVPGGILRNRTMVAADIGAFLLFGGFFSFIFLVTLMMQQLLEYSPTRTGVAWLATSLTAFLASALAGARLIQLIGVKRLLVVGLLLLTASAALLTRVPADAKYGSDLLLPFLLAGIAIGFTAPSVQIGALSGVARHEFGLASGLIGTMQEIGGAVGVAAVSTVLIERSVRGAGPVSVEGFQSAFIVILIFAALGALVTSIAFPGRPKAAEAPAFGEEILVPEAAAAD